MSTGVYLLTIALFLGTVLVIFGMKYFSSSLAARARLDADAALQKVAEQNLAAHAQNQAALAAMRAELARLATSVAAIETILKQVE